MGPDSSFHFPCDNEVLARTRVRWFFIFFFMQWYFYREKGLEEEVAGINVVIPPFMSFYYVLFLFLREQTEDEVVVGLKLCYFMKKLSLVLQQVMVDD
ncbi:hypothetical protein CIPAW_15G083200 [Carya illinoinensis]|uniref:Uncharacterized protein n=1 Tax=Carya illinoinensis TaxID=32201 RepID=A0A8T1NAL2_CARIL|nr:hypothetical protein CIPAW_15G083200 [Carya illinoinensis]